MEDLNSPQIDSFVIRFVQPEKSEKSGSPEYRGTISHVQSDQQIAFTRWEDAVAFISRFVPTILEQVNRK